MGDELAEVTRLHENASMKTVLEVLRDCPNAAMRIDVVQQPEPLEHRVVIEGDIAGFRMLAEVLHAMAEFVKKGEERKHGWQLVLDSESVPQLAMPENYRLRLECIPNQALRTDG